MKILFIILFSFTGFFTGALISGLTQSRAAGLAGGATVFVYSIAGLLIAVILSILFVQKLKPALLKSISIVLAIINLFFVTWVIIRIITITQAANSSENKIQKTDEASIIPAMYLPNTVIDKTEMGLGMAKPDFFNKRVLYFYSDPVFEKSASEHFPSDSIVFSHSDHHQYDTSYAPPWFYPEHQKMDYEILYLKIISLAKDWVEVEVNKETGQSAWISSSDVEIILWQEFLLKIFSVEILYPEKNLLRVKPLPNAGLVHVKDFSIMSPVQVKNNWIKVILYDDDFNHLGEAWIQWHTDGKLLISYSLLS